MLHAVAKAHHVCQAYTLEIDRACAGASSTSFSAMRAAEHDLLQYRHSREALLRWLVESLLGEAEIRRLDRREAVRHGEGASHSGVPGEPGSKEKVDAIIAQMEETGKEIARGELEMLAPLELRWVHSEARGMHHRREMGVADVEDELSRIEPHYKVFTMFQRCFNAVVTLINAALTLPGRRPEMAHRPPRGVCSLAQEDRGDGALYAAEGDGGPRGSGG